MGFLLRPEAENDQAAMLTRRMHPDVGETEVQGQQGSRFVATDRTEVAVVRSAEPLIERRPDIVSPASQERRNLFR